jgi:hypothetical protein
MNVAGQLELTTTNGAVEASDIDGGASIHTTNGGIRIDGLKGALEAVTTNGGIRARLNNPEAQKTVRLESSNGPVDLTVDNPKDNDIRVSTSNSSITVRLPANAGGVLRAHTSHGQVNTDFDVHSRNTDSSRRNVEGTIGGGGPILDLSTSNGSISLLKL